MRRLRFPVLFRGAMFALAFFLVWSIWAGAVAADRALVRILKPEAGATYPAGSDIPLEIETIGFSGVTRVVYYVEPSRTARTRLGAVTNAPFELIWTNAPPGIHAISAEAIDEEGNAEFSEPVKIRVRGSMGRLTFGLDNVEVLQRQVLGNPAWQYIASLIYVILAFYVSKLLDLFVRVRLRVWASRTKMRLDDLLVECLHGPVKIVAFVVLLHVGLHFFDWEIWVQELFSRLLLIIVAVSLTYMAIRLVDVALSYWKTKAEAEADPAFDRQLFPIISKSVKLFVIIVAVLVTSQNLGLNITGIIASLSIGGLALGLAAQDTLGNLFGAVSIFVDKPFRVGDRIQLDGIDGTVEVIGMRSTRVRNLDGHLITVPNKTMGNATITNITKRPNIRTLMNIGVTYDTPVEKVQRAVAILNEVFTGHPMTHDVWIAFNKFESASLNIFVIHWWKTTVFKDYMAGMQEMNLEIKRRFDAEAIDFAFPTQTLYVKQDSDFRVMLDEVERVTSPPGGESKPDEGA